MLSIIRKVFPQMCSVNAYLVPSVPDLKSYEQHKMDSAACVYVLSHTHTHTDTLTKETETMNLRGSRVGWEGMGGYEGRGIVGKNDVNTG